MSHHTACVTYVLRDPVTLEVRYVGLTLNPMVRAMAHRTGNGTGSPVERWKRRLRLRGVLPVFEVHHCFPDYASGTDAERASIARHAEAIGPRLLNREGNPPFRGSGATLRFVGRKVGSRWLVRKEYEVPKFRCNLCTERIDGAATIDDYLGMNWGLCPAHSESHKLRSIPVDGGIAVIIERKSIEADAVPARRGLEKSRQP